MTLFEQYLQFITAKADLIAAAHDKEHLVFRLKPDGYLYVDEVKAMSYPGIEWSNESGLSLETNRANQDAIKSAYTFWVNENFVFAATADGEES